MLSSTIMLRRLKSEVLQDLPNKTRTVLPLELDNYSEYMAAEDDFIEFLRRTKGEDAAIKASTAEYLVRIEGLKQLVIEGKISSCIQWIADFLEENGKLVVFAVHRKTIDKLMQTFGKVAVRVDGSCSTVERDKAVKEFQQNPHIKLFVGNVQAAGTGITLTAASAAAFVELPWTSGDLTQAEDRIHRIGQKEAVNIYYLLAHNTIEERIAELLDDKRKILSEVLDGKEVEYHTLLTTLLQSYQNQKEQDT